MEREREKERESATERERQRERERDRERERTDHLPEKHLSLVEGVLFALQGALPLNHHMQRLGEVVVLRLLRELSLTLTRLQLD